MSRRLATVVVVLVLFAGTGCRARNDRTATVTEPPVATPPTVVTPTVEPVSPLSEEEITDLERQLDEIDRLLTDAERAFDDD